MKEKRLEKEKEEKGKMTGCSERVKCNDKKIYNEWILTLFGRDVTIEVGATSN